MADDALRGDLANATDPTKGAALVGYYGGTGSSPDDTVFAQLGSTPLRIEAFGAVGDGVTDDTAAFQAAYAALATAPRPLWLEQSRNYLITQQLVPLPPSVTLYGNGSTITYARSDASKNTQFSFGDYTRVLNLTLHVPSGFVIRRFATFGEGASADGLTISSADQQPLGEKNQDACIWAFRNNVRLRNLQIHNWDLPIRLYHPDFIPDNVEIEGFKITSYGKGIIFSSVTNSRIHSGSLVGKSPNAETNPGYNAIGGAPGNGCSISDIYINESGEHGIYFSNPAAQPRGLRISNITLENTGQCGIKVRGYHALSINGIVVNDCATGNLTGSNEDGLRLEQCVDVLVSGYRVMKTLKAQSCNVGAVIAGSTNVYINGFYVDTPAVNGTEIATQLVVDKETGISTPVPCHDIYFNGFTVRNSVGACINVRDSADIGIGNIHVSGSDIDSPASNIITVDVPSPLTGPISVNGVARTNNTYVNNINNTPGVNVSLLAKDATQNLGLVNRMAVLDLNNFVPGNGGGSLGTLALRCAGTTGQGNYGGSISFRGIGVERRKAAIASVQNGANASQTGIAFLATDSSTIATDEVFEIARITGGGFRPGVDNSRQLGSATYRWSEVYAATGAINTSDARLKTEVAPLSSAEITCAQALAREIGWYQWLQQVADKGSAARRHFGMTVQRAIEVFKSHDLDPFAYGAICYDEYEAEPEVRYADDETGKDIVVRPARPVGDVYSFRWDELGAFIMRGIVAAQDALESRVAALETK
ncbi:Peptidase S74 domain-containing protein [Bordetella tumbae]|uniref:tail fiber domain-containing protein n=1 Tax=Bordetella tumbae TaxID=1649139 RepID=UPI0039EF3BDD